MDKILLERLTVFFSSDMGEMFVGEGVDEKEVQSMEVALGIDFDEGYRDYIKNFGGSFVGVPVYAANNNSMLSDETVVELNRKLRLEYESDPRGEGLTKSLVFSVTDMGDPIMVNPEGKIVTFYHDDSEVEELACSFDDYIETLLQGFEG